MTTTASPGRKVSYPGKQPSPHPRVLGVEDLLALRDARTRATAPALFARKFTEDSWPALDRIEEELWPLP